MSTPKIASTRIVKDKDTGEWVVKAYGPNGERLESCDYYTDDKEDAEQTAERMRGEPEEGSGQV